MAIQRFTQRALDAIDRVYGIVGPVSRVDALDVSPPILVHDVSREAEVAAGFPYDVPLSAATAGAGPPAVVTMTRAEILATAEVATRLGFVGLEPPEVDIWLRGVSAVVTSLANLGTVMLSATLANLTGVGTGIALGFFDGQIAALPLPGGAFPIANKFSIGEQLTPPWPILLPDAGIAPSSVSATVQDNGGGALVATGYVHTWIGPKGILPPGA